MAGAKAHPFIPGGLQTPAFLKWLRRTHAWLGVGGALIGAMFGFTTLQLEHDNFGLEVAAPETTEYRIAVPGSVLGDVDTFADYVADELGTLVGWSEGRQGGAVSEEGYNIQFRAAAKEISVSYKFGNDEAEVRETKRGFMDSIVRLHLDTGVPVTWQIISDAFTGALIVLSLTGIMLWTRLHGGRLLAVGLFGIGTLVVVYVSTMSA